MCKYCDNVSTGIANELMINEYIEVNGLTMYSIQTCLVESVNHNSYIETTYKTLGQMPISKGRIKIQYCPVCGRKLTKEPK